MIYNQIYNLGLSFYAVPTSKHKIDPIAIHPQTPDHFPVFRTIPVSFR